MLNCTAEVLGLIPRGQALIQLQPRVVEHTAQRPDQAEGDPPDQVLMAQKHQPVPKIRVKIPLFRHQLRVCR